MAAPTAPKSTSLTQSADIPPEVIETLSGIGMLAAGANVIMQLAVLPVGHGVAKSRVETGRIDQHPIKRTRTTLAYLAVALLGTEADRDAMRRAVNTAHRQVHSLPGDPVEYNAFSTDLQLWVAACLYKGLEDVYEALNGAPPTGHVGEVLYRHGARLGTTLQVKDSQWPKDRAAFQAYWDAQVATIEMDDVTRPYLQGVAGAAFVGPPFSTVVAPILRLFSVGFLPPEFQRELGLPWNDRRQQVFERAVGLAAAVDRRMPTPIRLFPFNAYLWDFRRRVKNGKNIV